MCNVVSSFTMRDSWMNTRIRKLKVTSLETNQHDGS